MTASAQPSQIRSDAGAAWVRQCAQVLRWKLGRGGMTSAEADRARRMFERCGQLLLAWDQARITRRWRRASRPPRQDDQDHHNGAVA